MSCLRWSSAIFINRHTLMIVFEVKDNSTEYREDSFDSVIR